jgi:predicted enzyme related to lactoylglutathione lyase/uncharacterized glyoxalase superfamily protein PhnB
MADPFDVLAEPLRPVDPDPQFARRLRARLERALTLPRGVSVSAVVSTVTREPSIASTRGGAVPYLAVGDARGAIDWYTEVLGARRIGEPIVMPDGRVGHAALAVGGGVLYLADAHPEIGVVAPTPGQSAVSLMLEVDDTDARLARALDRGARQDREVYEDYGHRNAWIVDPFGHRWCLQGPVTASMADQTIRHGDVGYLMWQTPDVDAAARFYAYVLGWQVDAGSVPEGRRVGNTTIGVGLWGGQPRSTGYCCFAVESVDAAVADVRAAGGTADEPRDEPYGRMADCVDDQGLGFAVYQPESGVSRPPVNGAHPGDVGYLTFEVPDPDAAHDFYGAVFGWRRTPEEQWSAQDPVPMHGVAGGRDATVVPTWTVEAIHTAVERVRTAGGTATDPEHRPYGWLAACVDDQGGRFQLGDWSQRG